MNNVRIAAVISAAGLSSRMGGVKKEYRFLPCVNSEKLTVLGAAARVFSENPRIGRIVITVPQARQNAEDEARAALPPDIARLDGLLIVRGGESRCASVYSALAALDKAGGADYALVHDGARPWVSAALVDAVIDAVLQYGAAIPVLQASETPKIVDEAGFIAAHPDRRRIVFAQTPQGFLFAPLLEAYQKALRGNKAFTNSKEFTDDAGVWGDSYPNAKIAAVQGEAENRKITFPADLAESVKL